MCNCAPCVLGIHGGMHHQCFNIFITTTKKSPPPSVVAAAMNQQPQPPSSQPGFEIVRMRTDTTRVAPPLHVLSRNGSNGDSLLQKKSNLELPEDHFIRDVAIKGRNPDDWGEIKTFNCLHDGCEFTGLVISIPLSYSAELGYEMKYQFCSFSCGLAYVIDKADLHVSKISNLLHRSATEVYDFHQDIKPASPREILDRYRCYGGGITIEEFRRTSCKPVRISLVRPPFYVSPEYMVSQPLRGHPDHHQLSHLEHMTSRATGTPSYVKFSAETMDPELVKLREQQKANSSSMEISNGGSSDDTTNYKSVDTQNLKRHRPSDDDENVDIAAINDVAENKLQERKRGNLASYYARASTVVATIPESEQSLIMAAETNTVEHAEHEQPLSPQSPTPQPKPQPQPPPQKQKRRRATGGRKKIK